MNEKTEKNLLLFAKSNFELKPNRFLKYCCLCDKMAQTSLLMSFCHFGYYFWCDFYSHIDDVSAFNPTKRERERKRERLVLFSYWVICFVFGEKYVTL